MVLSVKLRPRPQKHVEDLRRRTSALGGRSMQRLPERLEDADHALFYSDDISGHSTA